MAQSWPHRFIDDDVRIIGENVRRIRKERRISSALLADRINSLRDAFGLPFAWTAGTVLGLERERVLPLRASELKAIARALGVHQHKLTRRYGARSKVDIPAPRMRRRIEPAAVDAATTMT